MYNDEYNEEFDDRYDCPPVDDYPMNDYRPMGGRFMPLGPPLRRTAMNLRFYDAIDLDFSTRHITIFLKRGRDFDVRNERYGNAYGDYRGGYGPPGGFGPRPLLGFDPVPGPNFPSPGPYTWGRGFGPSGPPIRKSSMADNVIKYLNRCGVPKEHLKNLPQDLLQLIEPQNCGLCAQSFDSFAVSRIHYVSKNHLKAQKKWLNQNSDGYLGTNRARELPLKARELYCELCDVHITSKTHAESHYAGKAHRAIVLGRKNPKNPFLLQNGMEGRLDQLVRREKKFLKTLDDEDKEIEEVKDTKPVQPELYCDMCKTSVTCTEQMTIHKNGKRHLAKEKQFIFKFMEGETDDGNQYNEGGEEEAPEDDQEEAAAAGGSGEKYDWGDGEGKWEEANNGQ